MYLHERILGLQTAADLAKFINDLVLDLKANPKGWQNTDLASYLAAIAGWVEDITDEEFTNTPDGPLENLFQSAAFVLLMGSIYE